MSLADPITTEVVRNFVISCAMDMNAALWRSAFSALIYESRDSAVALLDEHGNMLGQSTGVPSFIGAIDACVKLVLDRYGTDVHQGDIFLMNDSYLQGTHLHDVTAVGPLFFDGELVGFAATRAHWQDIGAIDPGSTMGSTSIFHEGLRLGPTRIVSKFKEIPEWYDLLQRNTRLKDMTIGDLNAQIAAIRTGERRLQQVLGRIGVDVYRSACANIFRQAELLDRAAIRELKEGTYYREGFLDNDGVTDEPVKVALKMTIEGDRILIDLEGSSGPVKGPINCGSVQTISLLRLAYKTMINPERAITGGSFTTLEVKIPEVSLFNAQEPAACEWYFTGLGLLADLMISCFGEAMPDKATAAHYGDSMVSTFFSMEAKQNWISVEPTAGGWGAMIGRDGEDAMINLVNGAFRNVPAEVYESKFPVRVEEFSLRTDSGGSGKWRGGCGVVRAYRLLEDCSAALWFERSRTTGWGIMGGGAGAGPAIDIILPDGTVETPLKMRSRAFPAGTLVITRTGGGGGYGEALDRDPEAVRFDVRAGMVSKDAAAAVYGVALTDGFEFDPARSTNHALAG